jgi:hypothetical protein
MAITTINQGNPSVPNTPSLPDPKIQKKQIKDLEKDKKTILDIKKNIQDSTAEIQKTIDDTFGKTAQLVCLLRLDMVADRLENSGHSKLAHRVDEIANALEAEMLQ